jgi:hypothetical protein
MVALGRVNTARMGLFAEIIIGGKIWSKGILIRVYRNCFCYYKNSNFIRNKYIIYGYGYYE